MRKFMVAAIAALSLSACFADKPGPIITPAPLTQTAVDEQALTAAYASFAVLLTAIDGLRDVGVLVPGTPKALKVKDLIEKAQRGLNTARDVRAGLSTEDPAAALSSATAAFSEIAALLKEV